MRNAGYRVTVQSYDYTAFSVVGRPEFAVGGEALALASEWHVARLSGSGALSAPLEPLGPSESSAAAWGCAAADFSNFTAGHIALIRTGGCELEQKVAHAAAAKAGAVVLYNQAGTAAARGEKGKMRSGQAYEARLAEAADVPVIGVLSHARGEAYARAARAGQALEARLDIRASRQAGGLDYNLIADSPFGDPQHVVVIDAHLDAIYGAGMLDNASGSATILEVALKMAKTPTKNQLRYIWFGGEELGLLGSRYYTRNLPPEELAKIDFNLDADVTATPNYAILIADPKNAHNASRFPANVIPESRRGNKYFANYFKSVGLPSEAASFGNDGTDSNSFSKVGVPNTGILTQQGCCKSQDEVDTWGGFLGNYEGNIPSSDGGCVDMPRRWCDNLSNNSPEVLEFISKAVAFVSFKLANDTRIRHLPSARPQNRPKKQPT
jgi:hypothetical protein